MAVKSLIETVTVGAGGAASIEFTDIPQDGSDLVLMVSGRSDRTFNHDAIRLEPNSDSSNGSYIKLTGNGSSVSSPVGASLTNFFIPGSPATANVFGSATVYISNYTSATAKSLSVDSVAENNATISDQGIEGGLWNNTAAITSLRLPALNNWVQYSTASLYKIKYD